MPQAGGDGQKDPLMQPRVVRRLRDRPRLVDFGVREEMLRGLEENMKQRRRPDELSRRASKDMADTVKSAAEPAMERASERVLDRLNHSVFSNL